MSWFNFSSKKRPAAQGFSPKKKSQELPQAFILEPILTPSGLLDGTDNPIDPVDIDISADQIADIDIPEIEEGFGDIPDNDLEEIAFVTSIEGEETLEEIPFVTSLDDVAESEATDEALTEETLLNESPLTGLDSSSVTFESGVFTVGQTGEVSVDFLFDGGGYEGELAVFSLEGMEEFEPGSQAFIQEAASRGLSDSELGHIVISDQTEGARFVGELGESDRNSGEYLGVKTVQMRPGDEFGFMLVPNNTVQRVFDNPDVGGAARPLFSMATANPDDAFHVGQIADVTGDGSTFVMEDLRVDTQSDGDYNDVIFRVNGATGQAALLDNLIDPADDWRSTELGQKIAANVQSPAAPGKELPGDPIHPALPEPTVPQTTVDQGGDGFSDVTDSSEQIPESNPGEVVENTQTSTETSSPETVSVTTDNTVEPNRGGALPNTPTPIESSSTQDVIDQVSKIDPTDIYRVSSQQLVDTEISVLSGDASVSIQTPEGEVLSQQVLTRGTHGLTVPEDVSGDVLIKLESQAGSDGTYILKGFESKAEEPFNIDLEFEGLTASQRETIQAAAKSVESVIGQGLPSAIVDGKIIDDVNFKISVNNLDGVGGTLARTKVDFMRYGTLLPAQSITQFDVNDIAELEQSGQLFSVVQHEILHGLGFGNLWEAKGLVDYAGTPLAQYNGENAVAAFQDVGGLTDAIPLETEGEGSAGLHWHEGLFQDELMTADLGFQTGEEGETISPISPITLAALADLGYRVNLDKSTPGWGLLGGQSFNPDNLTKEQIKAFRQLTEETFAQPDDEFIYAIMSEVDPAKVSPEIWAHAERFWKNGEYYDWVRYQIKSGDTLSQIALDTMGSDHPDYYWFIANRNGIPNPNYIVTGNWIDIPVHRPNYEWEQEQERKRREEELRKKQEEEARKRREEEERLAREKAEQERKRREEEERRKEAEAKQRELEEQERRLREEQERKRQQEEYEREQARLRELERQREIARQKGKGGQDWFFATRLPEFGPTDPFETSLTGETVGNLVPDDYYRFNLSRKGRVTAELRQLLADADLVLYDVRNNPIAWSMRDGITDEQIIADLIPGTYMLRVNSPKGVTTDYDLIVKFQHLLSMTQQGPPPGWRVGGGNGNGGSGGVSGPVFADPRIQRIYDTALNNFATAERAKANARVQKLQQKKRSYEQELEQLLNQMNAEQRAKVHRALDDARHNANVWVDGQANSPKNSIDDKADWILGQIDSKIPGQVYNTPFIGDDLRNAKDNLKGAINGARSWLKDKVTWVQNGVKDAIWHFIEFLKTHYRTGGEINALIEQAANQMKRTINDLVGGINNWVEEFKGEILDGLGWLRNVGAFGWNFYDGVAEPLANSIANEVKGAVRSVESFANGAVDWVKPLAQKAVAAVVDAIFGDKTGNLYNKIHGVDKQIEKTWGALKKAITEQGYFYKKLLDNFVNSLGDAFNFVWGALMGEFNEEPSIWQVLLDTAIGMIPIAGEIGDVRDLIAYTQRFVEDPEEMKDPWNWVGVVGSLVGLVPVAGGAIKGVTKVARNADFVKEMRKLGSTVVDAVVDFAKRTNWNALAVKSKNFYLNILDTVEGLLRKLNDGIRSFDNLLPKLGILQPEYAGIGKLPDEGFFADLADNVSQLRREAPKKIDEGFAFLKGKLNELTKDNLWQAWSASRSQLRKNMGNPVDKFIPKTSYTYPNAINGDLSKTYQAHHLITIPNNPEEVHELLIAGADLGYDINARSNGIFLPTNKQQAELIYQQSGIRLPIHSGGHKAYSDFIRGQMDIAWETLENKGLTNDKSAILNALDWVTQEALDAVLHKLDKIE